MLKQLLSGMLLLSVALTSVCQQTSKRPNVIIIYSDDQGAADLGVYGSKDLITPYLDQLSVKGTRFLNFYAAAPVCSPSRASLLTGRYPQRAGLSNNARGDHGADGMPGAQYTMAEMFKDAGYKTAHIGKWHLGYSEATMPNQQGFDYSFGFMGGCVDNYSHFFYWDGPNRHDLWRNGQQVWEPGQYFPDLMVAEAGRFMKENRKAPFFMYFAINLPHYPLQGETKWLDRYRHLPAPRNMYAAFISTMDEKIGLLLKQLDKLGLTNNTIVVFQSDHGFSTEMRTFGGGGSAGQLRGSKFSLLEGGIKVPAIISWPGHIPQNEAREQFCTNIDWLPTLADYCNIRLPQRKIDGKSIKPVIESANAASPHQTFYWQSQGTVEYPQWAVREGDWKLLHNPYEVKAPELPADKLMLVNLKEDSTEHTNRATQHPEIVQQLRLKYEAWIKEVYNQ